VVGFDGGLVVEDAEQVGADEPRATMVVPR
jgi:hypothetical protein